MKNYIPEITLDMPGVSNLRIVLNGQHYTLTPQTAATPDDRPAMLAPFVAGLIAERKRQGRHRTAEIYRCTLNSLQRYLQRYDIPISDITPATMTGYEQYLKQRGLVDNSTAFYMRVLRTIYKLAVSNGYAVDCNPFEHVYTGIGKTIKRAVTLDTIQQLQNMTGLTGQETLARDLFLFSFYTRGMAFVDMAYLQPKNIRNGILTYRRRKTGQTLCIQWEPQMQHIVEQHPSSNPDYLLPIIKRSNGRERSQYREGQRLCNAMLNQLGRRLGLEQPLTLYVARHSWASIARTMDAPLNVISEGLGHSSEKTTQIYLKNLNTNQLNDVNQSIIHSVLQQDSRKP